MLLNYFRTLRNLNRNVLLYLAATALIGFSFDGGVFTVLFNLYLVRLDFGPEFIGQVAAAGLLAFSLASLVAGGLGERWGYRAMMVLGLVLIIAGGMLLPLGEVLPERWLAASIFTLYILMLTGVGFYFVNAVPFVMSISSDHERYQAFSMQTALIALAAFTGSLAGGFLPRFFALQLGLDPQDPAAFRYPLVFAAAMLLPSIWLLFRIRPASAETHVETPVAVEEHPTNAVAVAPSRFGLYSPVIITLVLLSVVRFFQVSGNATVTTFFNVYMDTELSVPTAQIGLLAACARLIGVFAALSTPLLIVRWGAPRTVLMASIVGTLSILPLAIFPFPVTAGLGYIGVVAISSMRYPAFMIFSTAMVPPNWRGTLAGVGEFSGGLSFTGLAFVGGSMAEIYGFGTLFMLGGALTLVGTLLFYIWFMLPRNKRIPAPA